ncbi:hypothetical protein AB751O23_AP_00030 [Chlamydiales bacterium SCGC AB-751-O23]|jgi:hypothetical protein|nr:hypothetical protein AB751O23_AP_00030 [Chlamydiales bacterium SCGC AB-751-O23]
MDKRALFLIVFIFTLISTLLVAGISLYMGHNWLDIVLYSLATMWVVGIISQLLMHHLYLSILRPIEEEKYKTQVKDELQHSIPLDEIEKIDEVVGGKMVKKTVISDDKKVDNKKAPSADAKESAEEDQKTIKN